jgi:DNA-binding CsgD family transcriptional regulator
MRVACVSVVAPESACSLHERPALHLARLDGGLVGRERELAELTDAIESGAPAIWISGASGIGKTALLEQLAGRCRERALPCYWLGPHEVATPGTLRAIAGELARAAGARDCRRVLVIDDFAGLRPIESWFVDRFLPALSPQVTVVVADRAAAPAWRERGVVCALAPLAEPAARRYLELRGVAERLHAEILAIAEGIPAILEAAADEACAAPRPGGAALVDPTGVDPLPAGTAGRAPPLRLAALVDRGAAFYALHDSDEHRLAIAVLTAARATPYELLELAFDDAEAARDAFAWLSRLSVVDHTPEGLRPHMLVRKACERAFAHHAAAPWARAREMVRRFADHRIALARDPLRWVLDRLFVDRDLAATRELMSLPASGPSHTSVVAARADRAAIARLAAARHGEPLGPDVARWLDDERAAIDVVRDARGELGGYLCTAVLDASSRLGHRDPVLDACVAHLRAIGWFGPAAAPDARALVFRDWTVAGTEQAPSPGAAVLLAQMVCRLLTTPSVDHWFIVVDRAEPWRRALRGLGLEPRTVAVPRSAGRSATVIAADWRPGSIPAHLQRLRDAAARADHAPARVRAMPTAAVSERIGRAAGSAPIPALREAAPAAAAPAAAPDDAGAASSALERRIAQLARSAALSPREQEVLQLLLLGRNYAEIGTALRITPRTARFHQHNILEKIGAESRLDIVRLLL